MFTGLSSWRIYSKIHSCLCNIHGGSDMVPWSQLRQPFWGWLRTDLTSEFTHFNLVIHLSKAEHLAFRFCTILRSPAPVVPMILTECIPLCVKPFWTARNFPFCRSLSCFTTTHSMIDKPGRHTLSRCGLFPFDGSLVRLNILCI